MQVRNSMRPGFLDGVEERPLEIEPTQGFPINSGHLSDPEVDF
jgi:hypothetical protein